MEHTQYNAYVHTIELKVSKDVRKQIIWLYCSKFFIFHVVLFRNLSLCHYINIIDVILQKILSYKMMPVMYVKQEIVILNQTK